MPASVLSLRALNRTLLARQLLLERASLEPLDAIERLVGVQAQEPGDPYVALWSRLVGFDPAALSSLIEHRRAVRIALMRSTIHLVSADDALALRPVVQPVLDRELFRTPVWARGLEGVDLGPVIDAARILLDEKPRTLAELRTEMARRWPGPSVPSLAYAARCLLPLVQVPPRGLWGRSGATRLTTLDHWIGRPLRGPATEEDLDRTILRYLAAFGPATVGDAQAWSRLSGLRPAFDRLRPRLRTYRDERGRELFDAPDAVLADGQAAAPVRFLPQYDNVALAHDDRRRIVPEAVWPRVVGRIGVAAVLVDGFVAGRWRVDRAGDGAASLRVETFEPAGPAVRRELQAEGEVLLGLLAPDGRARDVRVSTAED